jgi:hypothetical protein
MPVNNEVTVDRLALKRAVSKTRGEEKGEGDLTLFYVEDGRFTVETLLARTQLKSAGQWRETIAMHSVALQRVVSELPPTKEVSLLYSNGWLFVGDERLSAKAIDS